VIARIWTGAVRQEDGNAYAAYMRDTGVAAYARTLGNKGIWMLRRDVDDRTEFVMFTLWDSLDAVKAFAGEDYETAIFYPEDERFLLERALRAKHFEVDTYEPVADERPTLLHGEHVLLRPLRVDDVARVAEIQSESGSSAGGGLRTRRSCAGKPKDATRRRRSRSSATASSSA